MMSPTCKDMLAMHVIYRPAERGRPFSYSAQDRAGAWYSFAFGVWCPVRLKDVAALNAAKANMRLVLVEPDEHDRLVSWKFLLLDMCGTAFQRSSGTGVVLAAKVVNAVGTNRKDVRAWRRTVYQVASADADGYVVASLSTADARDTGAVLIAKLAGLEIPAMGMDGIRDMPADVFRDGGFEAVHAHLKKTYRAETEGELSGDPGELTGSQFARLFASRAQGR